MNLDASVEDLLSISFDFLTTSYAYSSRSQLEIVSAVRR